MSRAPIVRRVFIAAATVLFGASVLGIFLSGPVVVRVPRVAPGVQTSPLRLRRDVRTLCSALGPRNWESPGNLDRVAEWVGQQLRESGLEVEFQDYRVGERTARNVVGLRRGSAPDGAAVVIGAHYDAPDDSAGADDNASGVAVLLELARTLPAGSVRRDCYLVAFGTGAPRFLGREDMGSYHFARGLVDRGTAVALMVSLHRVGDFTNGSDYTFLQALAMRVLYPAWRDPVLVLGDARAGRWIERVKHGLRSAGDGPVVSLRAPSWLAPVDLSDHAPFRRLGLPGVEVTDRAFPRRTGHPRSDTPDRLDYGRMADLVRALHGVLLENGPPPSP